MIKRFEFELHQESGLYLKPSEKLKFYMAPHLHVQEFANNKVDSDNSLQIYTVWLQNNLHAMLTSFLFSTTSLTWPSLLGYSLLPGLIRYRRGKFISTLHFIELLCKLLKPISPPHLNNLKAKLQIALTQRSYTSELMAEIIVQGYCVFGWLLDNIEFKNTESSQIKVGTNFDVKNYIQNSTPNYLSPLVDLHKFANQSLQEYVLGFYIHGSMSTLDYSPGYSDVDTLMIVKEEVVKDPVRLIELRNLCFSGLKFLYAIDPYQHHGFMLFTETDMKLFPQSYFPLILFDTSTDVMNRTTSQTLCFQLRDSRIERQRNFWQMCYKFRLAYIQSRRFQVWYILKNFIQGLILLPALYLQLNEGYVYKKYSLQGTLIREFKDDWQIIDKITQIRMEWPTRENWQQWGFLYQQLLALNPELTRLFYNLAHYPIPGWVQKTLGNNFLEECFVLSDRMLETAKEQGWLDA